VHAISDPKEELVDWTQKRKDFQAEPLARGARLVVPFPSE